MRARIEPRPLSGSLGAVPSKSDAHRKLICAALADAPTELRLDSLNDDIRATAAALGALGAEVRFLDGRCAVYPRAGSVCAAPGTGSAPSGGLFQPATLSSETLPAEVLSSGGLLRAGTLSSETLSSGSLLQPDTLPPGTLPAEILSSGGRADLAADASRAANGAANAACAAAGPSGPPAEVDCGESGSTLRFLVPVAAALGLPARFAGQGRLPARPMEPLLSLLAAHGCRLSLPGDGRVLPLELRGQLAPGDYAIAGNVSSQYVSGLLFALPLLGAPSTLRLTSPLESAGYVDMTLAALAAFGVGAEPFDGGWRLPAPQTYKSPGALGVDGDWSSAAFWLCAFALGRGGEVRGLDPRSPQGDKAVADILARMGAPVHSDRRGCAVGPFGDTRADCDVDARAVPDLVPVLAAAACGRRGRTVFRGCARLRLKESDRVAAVLAMLRALGGDVSLCGDDIAVAGTGSLAGGDVDGCADHRIVMAAAVASSLCRGPVTVSDAEAVAKSYPAFFDHFRLLGGAADVFQLRQ